MAIRRGTLYRVAAFARADGLIVLTNDDWNNEATLELSGALVFSDPGPGRVTIPDLRLHAGPPLRVPKAQLSDVVAELAPEQLVPVEEALTDILSLDDLLADPPRAPVGQPGRIDYPRWSNIYYAGGRVGEPPERRRYLVVSNDPYNRAMDGSICVRTTTSARRGGPTMPTLLDGVTKVVCPTPTFFSSHSVAIREARPHGPTQLFLDDMRTVAFAIREALALPSSHSS